MQGRLSPRINGRIQAFPWPHWREEFPSAAAIGLTIMEWTLDADRLESNPLMTHSGRSEICALGAIHGVEVCSVTGDCFMQEPFWKATATTLDARLDMFRRVIVAAGQASIAHVVVPLVDAGSVTSPNEDSSLRYHLSECLPLLKQSGVKVLFESDQPPEAQARLVDSFPCECVGINFDMGNSASLGWNPAEEIRTLGRRIENVHVKDRIKGGGTVPLGKGAVDFPTVFSSLAEIGYKGAFILQTARAEEGKHAEALECYAAFVASFLEA